MFWIHVTFIIKDYKVQQRLISHLTLFDPLTTYFLSIVGDLDRHTHCNYLLTITLFFHSIYFSKAFFFPRAYSLENGITLLITILCFSTSLLHRTQTPSEGSFMHPAPHTHTEEWMKPAAHKLRDTSVYGQNLHD